MNVPVPVLISQGKWPRPRSWREAAPQRGAGQGKYPLSREGYSIRPFGLPGLKSKKAAWLCGDHVEKEGWAFCSCKGRETCDQVRLSCSGQPAGWRGSCVSREHHSGEAQDPARLGLLKAPGLRCLIWKPLTTCGQ